MDIQEIANEHTKEIIKNIFSKLDDEEIYVIIELNNQLQDKISKIYNAIDYINKWNKNHKEQHGYTSIHGDELLEILGEKEDE